MSVAGNVRYIGSRLEWTRWSGQAAPTEDGAATGQ